MNRVLTKILPLAGILLAGCVEIYKPPILTPGPDVIRPIARPNNLPVKPPENATSVEDFDTTSEAERAAALKPQTTVSAETELGRTIASLGNPTDPGFWLETPLVSEHGPGRVVYPVTGTSVAVALIPIDGPATGGSRISLPAMRLIGAPLTSLPELIVFSQ